MSVDETYLELSFDRAGIRNSEKRLKGLISEVAVNPLKKFQKELRGDYELVEEIVLKRVASVIAYWCRHKHDPVAPSIYDAMSEITNTSGKNDVTLEAFYIDEVINALYDLAPILEVDVPIAYQVPTDELEYALLAVEEKLEIEGVVPLDEDGEDEEEAAVVEEKVADRGPRDVVIEAVDTPDKGKKASIFENKRDPVTERTPAKQERDIVSASSRQIEETPPEQVQLDVLNISAEQAWHMIYGLMGYQSEYVQEKMLPRWQQFPDTFEQDRRFLYGVFLQAIRNTTGMQYVAGNYSFEDKQMTVDQLWNHYFTDLSQNVGPQLSVARLEATINEPWWKKLRRRILDEGRKISPVWMLALLIALIFDGLTTYVSLDQTPMDGFMVLVFTVLITALFQIADVLVINYRQREFEADAMIAKYHAKVEQLNRTLEGLASSSDSFVQVSMERSRANADWKAAEDNRKMARRGRYWSARIADINIVVTAYGFAYMFLNAQEPMFALYEQIDLIFIQRTWANINLWVFLMVGLAITVSFVINTAQRTEILGWSMRRLKNQA